MDITSPLECGSIETDVPVEDLEGIVPSKRLLHQNYEAKLTNDKLKLVDERKIICSI